MKLRASLSLLQLMLSPHVQVRTEDAVPFLGHNQLAKFLSSQFALLQKLICYTCDMQLCVLNQKKEKEKKEKEYSASSSIIRSEPVYLLANSTNKESGTPIVPNTRIICELRGDYIY